MLLSILQMKKLRPIEFKQITFGHTEITDPIKTWDILIPKPVSLTTFALEMTT